MEDMEDEVTEEEEEIDKEVTHKEVEDEVTGEAVMAV